MEIYIKKRYIALVCGIIALIVYIISAINNSDTYATESKSNALIKVIDNNKGTVADDNYISLENYIEEYNELSDEVIVSLKVKNVRSNSIDFPTSNDNPNAEVALLINTIQKEDADLIETTVELVNKLNSSNINSKYSVISANGASTYEMTENVDEVIEVVESLSDSSSIGMDIETGLIDAIDSFSNSNGVKLVALFSSNLTDDNELLVQYARENTNINFIIVKVDGVDTISSELVALDNVDIFSKNSSNTGTIMNDVTDDIKNKFKDLLYYKYFYQICR